MTCGWLVGLEMRAQRYYTEYGLAIRGLVRHHQVDRKLQRSDMT